MKNTKIISGFPGVGKSYLFNTKNNNEMFKILDSDSSEFSWIKDENGNNTKERNPEFPNNYIKHIKDNIGKVDVIMVSSHDIVRKALKDNDIEYYIVYPSKQLKDEYIRRYKERGNNEGFINFISNNWDNFIDDIENDDFPIHIKLSDSSYYLKDIFTTSICDNEINYFEKENFIVKLNMSRRKHGRLK